MTFWNWCVDYEYSWWGHGFHLVRWMSRNTPWRVRKMLWTQRGSQSGTHVLWCRWWEGPNDHGVGEGPVRWKRHSLRKTRSYESKAMSYVYLMVWGFLNAHSHLNQICQLGDMASWVGSCCGTTPWMSRTSPKGCPKHHGHKGDPEWHPWLVVPMVRRPKWS